MSIETVMETDHTGIDKKTGQASSTARMDIKQECAEERSILWDKNVSPSLKHRM